MIQIYGTYKPDILYNKDPFSCTVIIKSGHNLYLQAGMQYTTILYLISS